MAKLWANRIEQFIDGDGNPYAGAQLFTYSGGSSTKRATYQDSASAVAHSNPIILDANGKVPAAIWLTEGVTYKFVLAPSGDTDPPTSPIDQIDNISGINDTSVALDQWMSSGLTATYVSGTQFTVPGDQTTALHPGRRLKITDAGGTKYATISASAYAALTTVTVAVDSGSLSSPISNLNIAVLTATNPSEPVVTDSYPIVSGSTDKTKKVRFELDTYVPTGTTVVITPPAYDVTLGHMPPGVIMDYAGSSVPTGWLECDGSAVSRTTYANLFTALSTTWGSGDGATTFNLPDFRGRARIGKGTGTVAETVAAASVDTAGDTFTVAANNAKWITGQAVVLTTTGGLPAGLSLATTYYLIRSSSTLIKFATSLANAQNGTAIDITTQGTGNHTLTATLTARTLAETGGEETHAMSSTELLAHTHVIVAQNILNGGGTGSNMNGTGNNKATNSTGGNAAMNNMQPFATTMAIIKY